MAVINKTLAPFTFSGTWDLEEYETGKFLARFLSSGTLSPKKSFTGDAFVVNAGWDGLPERGGRGGSTSSHYGIDISTNVTVIVGSGTSKESSFGSRTATVLGALGGAAGSNLGQNGAAGIDGARAFEGTGYFAALRYGAGGGGGGGGEGVLNGKTTAAGLGGAGGRDGGGAGARGSNRKRGDTGSPGTANTGGGGGGGGGYDTAYGESGLSGSVGWGAGGEGGSGIVLLRGILNQPPTNPKSITHETPHSNKSLIISTGGSTDPEGDPIKYVWERRVDSGAYVQIGITTEQLISDMVPTEGVFYQVRVKAVDDKGGESGYTTGLVTSINYNNPPVITMETTSLGEQRGAFDVKFMVDDSNAADVINVHVACDDVEFMRVENATRNITLTASFTYEAWTKAANGSHVITVTADDGRVAVQQTLTWTKTVQGIDVLMSSAIAMDAMPKRILIVPDVTMAAGAVQEYFACNNGFDAPGQIVWEDISESVITGVTHNFTNESKASAQWGVRVRAVITRQPGTTVSLRRIDGVIS